MKSPSLIRKGIPADELLKMRGRGSDNILVWPSRVVGKDEEGLIVEWVYPDCIVTLKRWNSRYRVAEVKETSQVLEGPK